MQSEAPVRLKEELAAPLRVLQDTARKIARVSVECRLPVVEQEYVQSFKVELIEAVLQWCHGALFSEICKMTDVFEGSIIRAFRRLQELLRQMTLAAKAIGNEELEKKFNESLAKLERPNSIIFSPCVYKWDVADAKVVVFVAIDINPQMDGAVVRGGAWRSSRTVGVANATETAVKSTYVCGMPYGTNARITPRCSSLRVSNTRALSRTIEIV